MSNNATTVSGNQILEFAKASDDAITNLRNLSPIQNAGLKLAVGVGIVAFVVILGLLGVWARSTPSMPLLPADPNALTTEAAQNMTALLDQYRTASEIALAGPVMLFDQVVVKVLLPLFTLILGYIFGARSQGSTSDSDSQ